MNNRQKIVKGGFYLAMVNIFTQFLSIGVNIILARLLVPADFGLIALSTTYIGLIAVFTNIGFGSSIIHNQEANQEQISTIYWINLVLSVLTFLAVVLTASFAADFYDEPRLTKVVWFSAINILLTPVYIIHYKIKERDLEFKLLSRITLISTTTGAIAGVIAAFLGLGVYALVIQILTSTIVRLFMVLLISKWRPSFVFNFSPVKGMIWYSIRFKLSNTVLYFERNIDYLILGKVFSSNVLGYYSFSYNIMYTPVKRISYIFSDVLFPSFSSIKDNSEKIIKGYFQSVQLISIVTFPIMTILAFNAEWIVQFIFGNKWNDAIPIVEVLCFAGAIQSISQVGGVIFSSIGKPEINLYIGIIRAILTTLAIIIGSFYSIIMVAYLLVLSKLLSFIVLMAIIPKFIKYSISEFINFIKGPIICVFMLSIMQIVFGHYETSISQLVKFIIMVIIALTIILSFNFRTLRSLFVTIKSKTI